MYELRTRVDEEPFTTSLFDTIEYAMEIEKELDKAAREQGKLLYSSIRKVTAPKETPNYTFPVADEK